MKNTKRIISIIMALVLLSGTMSIIADAASSATFPKIPALKISRIYQSDSSAGLCTWCSMATIQGYCVGTYSYNGKTNSYRVPGQDYEYGKKGNGDAMTTYLYKNFNGYYNDSNNMKNYPFPMQKEKVTGGSNASYEAIYNQLKQGKPVLVYRKGDKSDGSNNHASVVIAYNGSSSKLEASGFTVMEINRNAAKNSEALYNSYANNPQNDYNKSCYITLSKWQTNSGGNLIEIYYPKTAPITKTPTINLSYNSNGGSGSMASTTINAGGKLNLRENSFTKQGHTFTGWNVKRSDEKWYVASVGWCTESEISNKKYTKKVYNDKNELTFDSSWTNGIGGDFSITFYAQWAPNKLIVHYNANGGMVNSAKSGEYKIVSNLVYRVADNKVLDDNWTYNNTKQYGLWDGESSFGLYKTGYTFAGWGTSQSGGTVFSDQDTTLVPTKINSNITNQSCTTTLYAQWQKNEAALQSISIKTNPAKMTYTVGETLNTSGLVITAKYSDGATKGITSGFTCNPTKLNTTGKQIITVTYNGKTTTFEVTVNNTTPTQGKVKSVIIGDLNLNYKQSASVSMKVDADKGVKYTVKYESSNPKVATVDQNGKVTATKRGSGSAVITCTVTDQYGNVVKDTCTVNVSLTFGQKIIVYVLFGWIWY